jgi:multidrug resistance efflux pump
MLYEIKNWINGEILFSIDAGSLQIAVELAVKAKANLRSADLRYADLSSADLSYADLSSADLRYADLRYADLRYANLRYANLRYANLDYSCWGFSCKTKNVKVDIKIVRQIAAHLCVLDCDNEEYRELKKKLLPYAKKSHRAEDLGLVG